MRRKVFSLVLVGVVLALTAGQTGAQLMQLKVYDFYLDSYLGQNNYYRTVNTSLGNNIVAAAFTWNTRPLGSSNTPPPITNSTLYCLDLHGQINVPSAWYDVDRQIVPPDPSTPPPWNTIQVAWLYHTYGSSTALPTHDNFSTDARSWAAAVQVALWEMYIDQYWYQAGNPLSAGTFQVTSASHTRVIDWANYLLGQVKGNLDHSWNWTGQTPRHCYWYEDQPNTPEYGQDMIGDVPEPGALLMLGAGIVLAAGTAWRRRRN